MFRTNIFGTIGCSFAFVFLHRQKYCEDSEHSEEAQNIPS